MNATRAFLLFALLSACGSTIGAGVGAVGSAAVSVGSVGVDAVSGAAGMVVGDDEEGDE